MLNALRRSLHDLTNKMQVVQGHIDLAELAITEGRTSDAEMHCLHATKSMRLAAKELHRIQDSLSDELLA